MAQRRDRRARHDGNPDRVARTTERTNMPRNANGQRPSKADLPQKTCPACNRPFSWRRKWKDCWNTVRYCSERCRNQPSQKGRR
ncbi:DUF2256 domain-containing protein [Thalassospira lucentensis]|uniref:DUF2256 domain-containing protein n=2 Tax=Thalassospira lucentensis TaxID=168935 RepID=UPI00399D61EC